MFYLYNPVVVVGFPLVCIVHCFDPIKFDWKRIHLFVCFSVTAKNSFLCVCVYVLVDFVSFGPGKLAALARAPIVE